jgi:hypothetical protein
MSEEDPAAAESELSAARRALAARIVRHEDKLAHALLACLYLLSMLHDKRLPAPSRNDFRDSNRQPTVEGAPPVGAARPSTFDQTMNQAARAIE